MKRILAALLLVGMLAGCGGVLPGPAGRTDQGLPDRPESVDSRLVKGTDSFGIALLKAVYAGSPGENLFLSPTSAGLILTLTANGARGETQREMLERLGYGGMELGAVNQATADLQGILLNPDSKVEVSVANGIWYQKGSRVAAPFLEVATQRYRAQVQETAFGSPESVKAINGWVSKETRGRIPELVDKTDGEDLMWLVNALYFKGAWQKPFSPAQTTQRAFHRQDGSTKQLPFMQQVSTFRYLKGEGMTGIRLPYGEGRLSFYAFMPDQWEGFLEGLTPEGWAALIDALQPGQVNLAMPKVKLDYEAELVDFLVAMGMVKAFDPKQADLSGLFEAGPDLYIRRVIQKSFLEINEEGTEAAAATGVAVAPTSAPAGPPEEVVLDHPFLLAIRDDRTGVLLFLGAVLEP